MKPRFRCSSLPRALNCNGSITMLELVRRREGGKEANIGTYLHWRIAQRLVEKHGAIAPDDDLPEPKMPDGFKLLAFDAWIIEWAVRHVISTIPPDWTIYVELDLAYDLGDVELAGHIDIFAMSSDGKMAIGMDWKTGMLYVEPAPTNEQVMGYVVLAKTAWPELESVGFEICQPKADEEAGFERITTVCAEGETLALAPATLNDRLAAAYLNKQELNTGEKQCKYCVGCSCPALREEQNLMKMTLTPEILAQIKETPDDAMLGDFVITGRMLAKPLEDAEDMLHERLDVMPAIRAGNGTRITRKVTGGSYTVLDPLRFYQETRALVPDDAQYVLTVKPSMTALKDQIAEGLGIPKTGKAPITSESVFKAKFGPLIEQGERRILQFQ